MRKPSNKQSMASMRPNAGSVQVVLLILLFIITVAVTALGVFAYLHERAEIDSVKAVIQSYESRMADVEDIIGQIHKDINLTIPSVQKVDNVFFVSKISTKRHLTGVKIKGIMINTSSVEHNDVKFRITAGDKFTEFTIKRIPPGSSSAFSLDLPDVALDDVRTARIETLASSVSYFVD